MLLCNLKLRFWRGGRLLYENYANIGELRIHVHMGAREDGWKGMILLS